MVIVGPTASGKTALAVELARRWEGEIMSADSRQIYRGMDIGTAKPTPAERTRVTHHLVDVVEVSTSAVGCGSTSAWMPWFVPQMSV